MTFIVFFIYFKSMKQMNLSSLWKNWNFAFNLFNVSQMIASLNFETIG